MLRTGSGKVFRERLENSRRNSGVGGLGRKEVLVDVRSDAGSRNCNITQELVQLLVVANGKHDVTRYNALFLVVLGGIAGQLEDLSGQVLENGSQIDGCSL